MDISSGQLTAKLKQLRLSGVLDTLAARERQARAFLNARVTSFIIEAV